jgi:DNA-binding winged helix-turn-helix (wHTH) protein
VRFQVLGLMLARAGRIVSQDALIDAIWHRNPPVNPVATLQVHIWRSAASSR